MPKPATKTVAGMQVYDHPWHCAFCRRRYRRRHLFQFWEVALTRSGDRRYTRHTLRICASEPDTKVKGDIVGCFEMGIQRLLRQKARVA